MERLQSGESNHTPRQGEPLLVLCILHVHVHVHIETHAHLRISCDMQVKHGTNVCVREADQMITLTHGGTRALSIKFSATIGA